MNNWTPETAEERDDRLGELLHLVSMLYFTKLDMFMGELAQSSNIVYLRFPAECMVGLGFETTSILCVVRSKNLMGCFNVLIDLSG